MIFSQVWLLQNCTRRIFLECVSALGFSLPSRQMLLYLNLLIFLFLKIYFKLDLFHWDKWPNQSDHSQDLRRLLPLLLAKECFVPRQAWFLGNTIHLSAPGTSPANMLSLAQQSPGKKGRDDPSRHPSCHCKSHLKHTFIDDDLEASSNPKVSPWVQHSLPSSETQEAESSYFGQVKMAIPEVSTFV